MNSTKLFTAVTCMTLMTAASAIADDWNKKTVITFSGPVEIPGVHLTGWGILPAGTYVFKVMDSSSDRHIVQIFSKDETTVYATILAIPNLRLRATDKTVMTFRERPAGQPEALRAWFYPGMTSGGEFVYPREKAMELAKSANTPVLFTSAQMPMEVSEPSKLAEAPVIAQLKEMPIMAVQPTGEEVQLAQVVTPPAAAGIVAVAEAPPATRATPAAASAMPQPASQAAAATAALFATASLLPLVGLCGLLCFAAALTLSVLRKRVL